MVQLGKLSYIFISILVHVKFSLLVSVVLLHTKQCLLFYA